MLTGLTIGKVADTLHINPKTIRYYEEVGLVPEPRRSESGYRLYTRYDVERLRLIRQAKLLGLSLPEIREIVEYAIDGQCRALEQRLVLLIEDKLGEIDEKINDLISFRDNLKRYHEDLSNRLTVPNQNTVDPNSSASCECLDEGQVSK